RPSGVYCQTTLSWGDGRAVVTVYAGFIVWSPPTIFDRHIGYVIDGLRAAVVALQHAGIETETAEAEWTAMVIAALDPHRGDDAGYHLGEAARHQATADRLLTPPE